MNENLLSVRDLAKSYRTGFFGSGRLAVLRGVDLDVPRAGRILVAGPNGSGKSTLLRILASLDRAGSGTALLDGEDVGERTARRRIGYGPDGCPFPMELSGRAMLRICGEMGGMSAGEARERADEMLARVGLGDSARRKLAHYSKGMRRRFTLAQAFLGEPDLLLLDEPTDGLDALGFGVLEQLLDEARERGAGVLLASHVAALDCDMVHVIWEGRIARSGSPAELLEVSGGLLRCYRELGA